MPDANALHSGYRGAAIPIWESAARIATPDAVVLHNVNGSSQLILVMEATAETATASVVITIQGYDPATGVTWDILAAAALDAVGNRVLRVSPHLTASANLIAKDIVPAYLRFTAVHADADSLTYQVTAHLVG
jgi:chemotaxis response regulator CheB